MTLPKMNDLSLQDLRNLFFLLHSWENDDGRPSKYVEVDRGRGYNHRTLTLKFVSGTPLTRDELCKKVGGVPECGGIRTTPRDPTQIEHGDTVGIHICGCD